MTEQQSLTERQLIIKRKTDAIKQKQLLESQNSIDNAYDTTLKHYGYSSLENILASPEKKHWFNYNNTKGINYKFIPNKQ